MANPNIQAGLVQGGLDEGQPAAGERPVLVAFKDGGSPSLIKIPLVDALGNLQVSIASVLASTQVEGKQANGAAITENPVLIAGQNGGNVKTLGLDASGFPTVNQGAQNAGGTASWNVQGAAAANAALSGNPLRLGVSDGTNIQDWKQAPNSGSQASSVGLAYTMTGLWSSAGNAVPLATAAAGGGDNANGTAFPAVGQELFNNTNWDRQRNNVDVTLLASASRNTTQTSADITTYNLSGITVIVDCTAGAGTVTLTINGKDPASGKYYPLLTGTAVTSATTNVYRIMPGLTAVANKDVNAYLPRIIQIVLTSNLASLTYSVGYTLHLG